MHTIGFDHPSVLTRQLAHGGDTSKTTLPPLRSPHYLAQERLFGRLLEITSYSHRIRLDLTIPHQTSREPFYTKGSFYIDRDSHGLRASLGMTKYLVDATPK